MGFQLLLVLGGFMIEIIGFHVHSNGNNCRHKQTHTHTYTFHDQIFHFLYEIIENEQTLYDKSNSWNTFLN